MSVITKPLLACVMVVALIGSAVAQQPQIERYQIVTVPASQSMTFPEVYLLDTATGQSWSLFQATGQAVRWTPLRFWTGQGQLLVPLPPSPDAIGKSP